MNRPTRALLLLFAVSRPLAAQTDPNDLSAKVEIIRTDHGVPHIRADDLKAFGYGLAWVQLEDYGIRMAQGILRTRGTMARVFGRDSIESDFLARPETFERAMAGQRQVVFVSGEPGIGKTSVIEAFLSGVERSDRAAISRGQCLEQATVPEPYLAVLDAFGRWPPPPATPWLGIRSAPRRGGCCARSLKRSRI